jgi:hypothetical protein
VVGHLAPVGRRCQPLPALAGPCQFPATWPNGQLGHLGFEGFGPYTLPNGIEVADAIPFIVLTG